MKRIRTGPVLFACLALFLAGLAPFLAGPAMAAEDDTVLGSHMTIADPAALSGSRAESVYQAIRAALRQNYTKSGDPAAAAYQNWRRYNSVPYRSRPHGERFLNNYANRLAAGYGAYEKLKPLPPGAVVVKDSFTVTEHGQVMTGPFFLLEKKSPGFNPKTGDWLFMMIRPDGRVAGITGGRNSGNVTFCAACHTKAPKGQDGLYFLPREVRR
jgi:hypothetical protein